MNGEHLPEGFNAKPWSSPRRQQSIRHGKGQQSDIPAKAAGPKQDIEEIRTVTTQKFPSKPDGGLVPTARRLSEILNLPHNL